MKPLFFSRHARGRLRLYNISGEDVAFILDKPDREAPTIRGRRNAFRQVNGEWLRVTYTEEERRLVIVTVTPLQRSEKVDYENLL